MQQVSETLAGRAAVLRLLPLAHRETDGRRLGRLPWELTRARTGKLPTQETIWRSILRGGYPEIALTTRATQSYGTAAMYRPISNGTSAPSARWETLRSSRASCVPSRRAADSFCTSAICRATCGVAVNTAKAKRATRWSSSVVREHRQAPRQDTEGLLHGHWHPLLPDRIARPAPCGGRAARRRPVRDRRPGGETSGRPCGIGATSRGFISGAPRRAQEVDFLVADGTGLPIDSPPRDGRRHRTTSR